jgi:hypothetical protein
MNKILFLLGLIALLFAFTGITNASLSEVLVFEPAIMLLLGFGLLALAGIGRKKIFKKKE